MPSFSSNGWNYEAAGNFNRTNHHFRNRNLIDGAKYTELINNGTYDANVDPDISKTARNATTPTIGCWEYVSAAIANAIFYIRA